MKDFRQRLRALNQEVAKIYGDDGSDFIRRMEKHDNLKNDREILLNGGSVIFPQDVVGIDKSVARELKKFNAKRRFFKKKNFYFTLTPEGKAVIFAARVKDEREQLVIPEKLGKYVVGGVCELKFTDRYSTRIFNQHIRFNLEKRQNRSKKAMIGILSFSNVVGHDKLEELSLRNEGAEITVAPSVKVLHSAMLPNAKILRLPSTLTYLGLLIAPQLEKIEVYDCGEPSEECKIYSFALSLCEKLSDLTLPTGVSQPPTDTLFYNYKVSRVKVSEKTTNLSFISGCGTFKELYVNSTSLVGQSYTLKAEKAEINSEVFKHIGGEIDDLTLTGGAKKLIQAGVKVCRLTMPDSIEELGDNVLCEQKKLTGLTLPRNLRRIGNGAFKKSGLAEIHIPDGVSSIGDFAFAGCENLSKVHLPSALTVLNTNIFEGSDALRELALPDAITEIKPHLVSTKNHTLLGYNGGVASYAWYDDLRLLGAKNAVDPLLRMHITYNENTPTAAAVEAYREKMRENIQANITAIEQYLAPLDKLTVTSENIDHVTAAISYVAAVRSTGSPLLFTLTSALASFFKDVTKKTAAEADFLYCNYFFDTIKRLKSCGQKQAFDILESCRADLSSRITASLKHAMKGEKLLSKNTPKAREEALYELVRAYHIYPRNAPTVIALIHWFASDPLLYDSKAVEKLLEVLEACALDTDTDIDYMAKANELIKTVKNPKGDYFRGFLTMDEKRKLYLAEYGPVIWEQFVETTSAPKKLDYREELKVPRRLSLLIDEKFFAELRKNVKSRMVSSFGGTVEFGEQCRQEKLDAIDAAEATIFPEKRKALEERLKKRREAEEKKRREEEEKLRRTQSVYSISTSSSYDDDRYGYGKGYSSGYGSSYDSSTSLFPNTFYSYSYNNPYSPVTELEDWARAEAIGIEWDIIDRDYYLDLGIFGDHVL
ncbi:MAG: leucine-rich repeat domain-containing protein [Ruminococcaceae bacterium]|nr:leucine-rich repeat domain-containing protein [Oscillospiraceae bacterium]